MPPVNADARSSVEIDDSCNCCTGFRRRPAAQPRKIQSLLDGSASTIKVRSASQPVVSQTAEDEWEISLNAHKITSEPSLAVSSENIDLKDIRK